MKAFAPANISCIFRTYEGNTPQTTGSLGMGITLTKGATVRVKKSNSTTIFVNGKKTTFPTVMHVVSQLTKSPIEINIRSDLPFGCGFGMSGASALSTAFALNSLFNLKKTKKELGMIAHTSEVEQGTGRGDVGGQLNGGVMIKTNKRNPLEVQKLRVKQKKIYYKVFSPIETKKIIGNKKKKMKINKAGEVALRRISRLKKKTFDSLIDISLKFSEESGLLQHKKVKDIISLVQKKKGKASMIMLGNSVFSTIPFRGSKEAIITHKGARLL